MRKIPKQTYQTPDEIDARVRELEAQAELLPPGGVRQALLKQIAQLRVYSAAKRWVEPLDLRREG